MAKVAEHARKDEGEGDDGVWGRVHLQVVGHPVGVDDALEDGRELVGDVVRWRRFAGVQNVEHRLHASAVFALNRRWIWK